MLINAAKINLARRTNYGCPYFVMSQLMLRWGGGGGKLILDKLVFTINWCDFS